jgi:hypothetical protein
MVWLQPAPGRAAREGPHEAHSAIERFLKASQKPFLMDPGEDPLAITPDTFAVTARGNIVTLACWSETRNLTRRVLGVKLEKPGLLELEVERFGGHKGALRLADLGRPANHEATRRGARLKYRERFRRSLLRQFPDWRIVEISAEPDLEHSLSPSYPRALLRKGLSGLAAIGAPEDALQPEEALTFGLIWLEYLRQREPKLVIEGLAVLVPTGREAATCHRVRYLNPKAARFLVYAQEERTGDWEQRVNPEDYTNLDTHLPPHKSALATATPQLLRWTEQVGEIEGVEYRTRPDGSVSFAVRGLEFARVTEGELLYGLDRKHAVRSQTHWAELLGLARGLVRARNADAEDRLNPLYARHPEAWLESQVRGQLDVIDASLEPAPIYGQVPEMASGTRGILDLVAVDRAGRLAVVELKATQDIHLPLQVLDYWMRVKWHQDRAEFEQNGYFPGVRLTREAPRLILVAPALEWHPANQAVLKYLTPEIDITRVGIGLKWRRGIEVMFRSRAILP